MIVIDGSIGEGGGQILRTALSLAALIGEEIKIKNIRAKRKNPGLRAQHLTAVKVLSKLCNAQVQNAKIGSKEIVFKPGKIENEATVVANIGTAGSISLVFQQVLPVALAMNLNLSVFGGTHVEFAPTITYMQNVTLFFLKKMHANAEIELKSLGYFPKGKGFATLKTKPSYPLTNLELQSLGALKNFSCFSYSSGMPQKVAKDLSLVAKNLLSNLFGNFDWKEEVLSFPERKETKGMSIDLFANYSNTILGANAIAHTKAEPEKIAKNAVIKLKKEIESLCPFDSYASDQIIPFIALASGKSRVFIKLTKHAKTNIEITERILGVNFKINENFNNFVKLSVRGIGFTI